VDTSLRQRRPRSAASVGRLASFSSGRLRKDWQPRGRCYNRRVDSSLL